MMGTPEDRLHDWIDAVLDRTRESLRAELEQLIGNLQQAAAVERDEAVRLARANAEAATADAVAEAVAAEHAAAQDRLREAVERTREEARAEREQALTELRNEMDRARSEAVDQLERRAEVDLASAVTFARADERQADLAASAALVDAIRQLDEASSLTGILNALADAAARHTARTALLVVRHGQLRGWRWSGFDESLGEASALELDADDDTLVGCVVRTRKAQSASGPVAEGAPLAPSSADRAAVALPVTVDGEVVAVLYGDDEGESGRPVPSAWPELLEVLARHAGRCLETMTARRLPAWLRGAGSAAGSAPDEAAAQRYARLLVSEIRLYNEAALEAARQEGNILERLRPQIARAQQLYAERVPDRTRHRADYFQQELLRTRAGGNPALLGQTP